MAQSTSEPYITRPGETFMGIMVRRYGITDINQINTAFEIVISHPLNRGLNIASPASMIRPYEIITFPGNLQEKSEYTLSAQARSTAIQLKNLDINSKKVLAEIDTNEQWNAITAVSEFLAESQIAKASTDMNTFGGSGIGAALTKQSAFADELAKFDKVLHEYRQAYKSKNAIQAAKTKVLKAFEQLQMKFGAEIKKHVLKDYKGRKPHPISNAQRAMHLARDSRNFRPIQSTPQVSRITKLASMGKAVGNGMIILDFGLRANSVVNSYNRGDDWCRELSKQSWGLLFSIGAGLAASLAFGPFGLLIVIVAVGVAAVIGDKVGQWTGENIYDLSRPF